MRRLSHKCASLLRNDRKQVDELERQICTSDALAVLHEGASGILRDIDRVAGNAPRMAARRNLEVVDRSPVSALLADENGPATAPPVARPRDAHRGRAPWHAP